MEEKAKRRRFAEELSPVVAKAVGEQRLVTQPQFVNPEAQIEFALREPFLLTLLRFAIHQDV